MVSRNRAGKAVRAVARSSKAKGEALLFLNQVPDEELDRWDIEDGDDNVTIYTFIEGKMTQGSAAIGIRPDSSDQFLRNLLTPAPVQMLARPSARELKVFLEGPLPSKLPVLAPCTAQFGVQNADILDMISDDTSASTQRLSRAVLGALGVDLRDFPSASSEQFTVLRVFNVVDVPLGLAKSALKLDLHINRNAHNLSGATAKRLRPDFLCWVKNVLVFKGEEKASEADMAEAIRELTYKMADAWQPELLEGVPMPGVLGYAAAGRLMQFFLITKRSDREASPLSTTIVHAEPVTECLDLNTHLGSLQAFRVTCHIARLIAGYVGSAPRVAYALGSVIQAKNERGVLLRTITFFEGFVSKRVYKLHTAHHGMAGVDTLRALYGNAGLASCPNLARLKEPGDIRVEDDTLVLHLVPVGEPALVEDEDTLRHAIRDVLMALAALHAAGFVHRDVRWANVIRARDAFVLIDLEHAARADSPQDCRGTAGLASWPDTGILDPVDGRYTCQSDLCLVAHCLMDAVGGGSNGAKLSAAGKALRHALKTRQLSAEQALQHEWLAAA